MAQLTIRKLDESVHRDLKVRAAANGRSMEAEARAILEEALGSTPREKRRTLSDLIGSGPGTYASAAEADAFIARLRAEWRR